MAEHMWSEMPERLTQLLSCHENSFCMDCRREDPDWASLQFGVTLCLDCAGKHRSFGTHITSVRSFKLDGFTEAQIAYIASGGNESFARYLEENAQSLAEIPYTDPTVLYYREILQARIDGREPVPVLEYSNRLAPDSPNKQKYAAALSTSPQWVKDEDARNCMICQDSFSVFNRKHHCRRCGKCVCKECAPKENTRPILEWGMRSPVRHCKQCYQSPIISWS